MTGPAAMEGSPPPTPPQGPLDILFRDERLIAITKPAGLLVHPGREPEDKAWIAMKVLRDQIGQRIYAIHRLDRPTSGVLLFAVDEPAADAVREAFETRRVAKAYVAIVRGDPPESWDNATPLAKEPGEPLKDCLTRFHRLRVDGGVPGCAAVRAEPHSGRHHQIRRHAAADGFALVGDHRYGDPAENLRLAQATGVSRLMLHAHRLVFPHPDDGRAVEVTSPLPAAFSAFGLRGP